MPKVYNTLTKLLHLHGFGLTQFPVIESSLGDYRLASRVLSRMFTIIKIS